VAGKIPVRQFVLVPGAAHNPMVELPETVLPLIARFLLTLPNCPEMVMASLAIQKLGAVAVNVGPLMGADDLTSVMAMTAPKSGN
jgi:hypothetical protein